MERGFGWGVRVTYRRRRRRGSFGSRKMRGGAKTRHGGNDWARAVLVKRRRELQPSLAAPFIRMGRPS